MNLQRRKSINIPIRFSSGREQTIRLRPDVKGQGGRSCRVLDLRSGKVTVFLSFKP